MSDCWYIDRGNHVAVRGVPHESELAPRRAKDHESTLDEWRDTAAEEYETQTMDPEILLKVLRHIVTEGAWAYQVTIGMRPGQDGPLYLAAQTRGGDTEAEYLIAPLLETEEIEEGEA